MIQNRDKEREYITIKELAEFMHERYEFYSIMYGWNTQEICKVEYNDLPDKNKIVMFKVAQDILNKLGRYKNE